MKSAKLGRWRRPDSYDVRLLEGPEWEAVLPGAAGEDHCIVRVGRECDGFRYACWCGRELDEVWNAEIALPGSFPELEPWYGCTRAHAIAQMPLDYPAIAAVFDALAGKWRGWGDEAGSFEQAAAKASWLSSQPSHMRRIALDIWRHAPGLGVDAMAEVTAAATT
ncbi:hypothetical protein [Geodermatophilus siccatus]|uniref:hypothetical protein n=1 Tax=Geodermatophilus siccatus TaxID=1137991 RepID=UPI001113A9A6|nr:hypothetical protein [Geodermatophilus siccatus]